MPAAFIFVDGAGLNIHVCKNGICSTIIDIADPLTVRCGRSYPTMLQSKSKMMSSLKRPHLTVGVVVGRFASSSLSFPRT